MFVFVKLFTPNRWHRLFNVNKHQLYHHVTVYIYFSCTFLTCIYANVNCMKPLSSFLTSFNSYFHKKNKSASFSVAKMNHHFTLTIRLLAFFSITALCINELGTKKGNRIQTCVKPCYSDGWINAYNQREREQDRTKERMRELTLQFLDLATFYGYKCHSNNAVRGALQ